SSGGLLEAVLPGLARRRPCPGRVARSIRLVPARASDRGVPYAGPRIGTAGAEEDSPEAPERSDEAEGDGRRGPGRLGAGDVAPRGQQEGTPPAASPSVRQG